MARKLYPGIGVAVARRSVFRPEDYEDWGLVSKRVAEGNCVLHPTGQRDQAELEQLISEAVILTSGRHLQHGDENQLNRSMETHTNCSQSVLSSIKFLLLLCGSGVGRDYSDELMLVDWSKLPTVLLYLSPKHQDFADNGAYLKELPDKLHYRYHAVEDSREGWAKVIEILEAMCFKGTYADTTILFDFSFVRPSGSPIGGMQDRPASGPVPFMEAVQKISFLKDTTSSMWLQKMTVDHYTSECVRVGGARRAARIATKYWKDKDILAYATIKKTGGLWSANNSIMVDSEFWDALENETEWSAHARELWDVATRAAYFDGSGEPGFINQDKLTINEEGAEQISVPGSSKYTLWGESTELFYAINDKMLKLPEYRRYSVNPCSEIVLKITGSFCVIGDLAPYFSTSVEQFELAARHLTRFLIRVNLMPSMFKKEVLRTNRIGVSLTGIHEYAWKHFGFSWYDLIDESKSQAFWDVIERIRLAVEDEARCYSKELGVNTPHTFTTIKPAGCVTLDTKIRTTRGCISMEEIFSENGYTHDYLCSIPDGTWLPTNKVFEVYDESNARQVISKLYVNGVQETYNILFDDGYSVQLTGNHKLKTLSGWKHVYELTTDDDIVAWA